MRPEVVLTSRKAKSATLPDASTTAHKAGEGKKSHTAEHAASGNNDDKSSDNGDGSSSGNGDNDGDSDGDGDEDDKEDDNEDDEEDEEDQDDEDEEDDEEDDEDEEDEEDDDDEEEDEIVEDDKEDGGDDGGFGEDRETREGSLDPLAQASGGQGIAPPGVRPPANLNSFTEAVHSWIQRNGVPPMKLRHGWAKHVRPCYPFL